MRRSIAGLTRSEVMVVVFAVFTALVILVGIVAPPPPARESSRLQNCKENLRQIGRAIYAYGQNYDEYNPFAWQRAYDAPPAGAGYRKAAMAMTSIANLYPKYLDSARCFRCPSTENSPYFALNLPRDLDGFWTGDVSIKEQETRPRLYMQRNWTLYGSSYGYDCRVGLSAVSNHAIAGDMDGSWQKNHGTRTQNHEGGQHVLYVDGHVSWVDTNFVSNNPADNIFVEDPWNADTDSYLLDTDARLGVSFNEYTDLHYR